MSERRSTTVVEILSKKSAKKSRAKRTAEPDITPAMLATFMANARMIDEGLRNDLIATQTALRVLTKRMEYIASSEEASRNELTGILDELRAWEKRMAFLEQAHPQLRKLGHLYDKSQQGKSTRKAERHGEMARAIAATGVDPALVELASSDGPRPMSVINERHEHHWNPDWTANPPTRVCEGVVTACGLKQVRVGEGEAMRWEIVPPASTNGTGG